ncbi:hypothetical protein VTK56DRAFT_9220 [Thermocarpiscus australiensis]
MDATVARGLPVLMTAYPLPHARDPGDDWTGITNTAERKRRQNRLNQRAYRRRKHARQRQATQSGPDRSASDDSGALHEPGGIRSRTPTLDGSSSPTATNTSQSVLPGQDEVDGAVILTSPQQVTKVRNLIRQAYENYLLNTPRPTHLHIVIGLNVLNAVARNAVSMGFDPQRLCSDESVSPYGQPGPWPPARHRAALPLPSCPDSLRPTALQRTTVHHPWIDLFPFPRFRDNVLRAVAADVLDEDELCCNIMDVSPENMSDRVGLIVWGESWDRWGWEASVPFLRKWGWLVRDCPEILEGTNRWRERRGERALRF